MSVRKIRKGVILVRAVTGINLTTRVGVTYPSSNYCYMNNIFQRVYCMLLYIYVRIGYRLFTQTCNMINVCYAKNMPVDLIR